jgi:SAM-dependent methyltransferase
MTVIKRTEISAGGPPDPAAYHAWYETPRGAWIANRELDLMLTLLRPQAGESLLDVGCGTGWFSTRFANAGLSVAGVDPDPQALRFARQRDGRIAWVEARAESLPFADEAFDYVTAVTSLCFVIDPVQAMRELWRVSRQAVVLGLLHRRSLLFLARGGHSGYRGARWDLLSEVRGWMDGLVPAPVIEARWAVFLPSARLIARRIEPIIPGRLALGSFLALCLHRRNLP